MTDGGLELRSARPADVDAVRGVVRHAFARYVSRIGRDPAPMSADYQALVAERAVTVALHGDAIVGVLVLRPQPQVLLLEIVAVAPAAQGRGVGRALIALAEQHACKLGLAKVALYTNARMTENLSFYPHLGYVEVGRRSEHGFDRVFFEKTVAASS